MIRALVLDFDGLILDTESAIIRAYADVHAAHGVPFDAERFLHAVGHADYAFDPWQAFPQPIDRAALDTERRRFNQQRDLELTLLPGVVALLDAAAAHGLRIALASNSRRPHCEGHLTRLGLRDRFDFLACRDEAPLPKPAPDLYMHAVRNLGVRGHEAIAFEDSHTGSLAAKRANLRCVAVPGAATRHHDFTHADLVLASLADCTLADLLKKFSV